MKKLITGILATTACLACLTACFSKDSNTSSTPNNSSVASVVTVGDAKSYLNGMYQSSNLEVRADYDLLTKVDIDGTVFTITWAVDVTTGVTIKTGENKVTVDVDENLSEDLTYVLTATITDPNGNTDTLSFTRKVLMAPAKAPQAITAAPVEETAYKYYVYQSTLQKGLYFAGSMDGYYFKTTENYEEAVDLYVEYVDETKFNIYFNHAEDGKQYIGMQLSSDGQHNNVVYASAPTSSFIWSTEYNTVITNILDKDGAQSDFYLGNYSTHDTISASKTSYAGGEGNNVGCLVTMVDKSNVSDADKVAAEKSTIATTASYTGAVEEDLATVGTTYGDVKIAWAVKSGTASITDNVLTIAAPTDVTTVTLTATLTCGEATDSVDVVITITPASALPAADSTLTIEQILALNITGDTTEKYYLEAEIKEVYSTSYGNMYVKDANGNELTIYGTFNADGTVKYGEMTDYKPVAGDTVKLYGILSTYNGKNQMKNAWIVNVTKGEGSGNTNTDTQLPAADSTLTIEQILALNITGDTTEKYYLEAEIKEVYNTSYGNMYVKDANNNELTIYGTFNADGTVQYGNMTDYKPVAGDTVKLYGILSTYNSKNQMKNAWIVDYTICDANKVATEKQALTIDTAHVTAAKTITLPGAINATETEITWTVNNNTIASIDNGVLSITIPTDEDVTLTITATIGVGDASDTKVFTILVIHEGGQAPTEPTTLATFDFGSNSSTAAHADGTDIGTTKTYTEGNYTLTLTNCTKIFGSAYDAKGTSCLKLGTSDTAGSMTFAVPANVSKVIINIAKYKDKATTISINGTEYTLTQNSNDGEYDVIEIDTSKTKEITLITAKNSGTKYRAMINSISYVGL